MPYSTTTPESLKANQTPAEKIWFCVRRNGEARHSGWIGNISPYDLLQDVEARPGDVVETCICGEFRLISPERFRKVFYPRALGLTGMEITFRGETVRYAPSWMLATNLRFKRALDRFLEDRGITAGEFADEGSLRAFSARQFLLPADGKE